MKSLLASLFFAFAAHAAEKPNILFLFADDQRADAVGAFNPAVKTPNIDTLVQRGFAFTNAYCLGANMPAVCTPSRNMLFSGRAFFRWQPHGEKPPGWKDLAPADGPNFAVAFQNAG